MGRLPLIHVKPKDFRSIVLYAVSTAKNPKVLVNQVLTQDFSESGPLTQKNIKSLRELVVRDGLETVLGFHGNPDPMWISATYRALAEHCQRQGWLKIQR